MKIFNREFSSLVDFMKYFGFKDVSATVLKAPCLTGRTWAGTAGCVEPVSIGGRSGIPVWLQDEALPAETILDGNVFPSVHLIEGVLLDGTSVVLVRDSSCKEATIHLHLREKKPVRVATTDKFGNECQILFILADGQVWANQGPAYHIHTLNEILQYALDQDRPTDRHSAEIAEARQYG